MILTLKKIVIAMEANLCILNRYFNILREYGYVSYTIVYAIILYFAVQELYNLCNWDNEDKRFMRKILNDLENDECLISSCVQCFGNKDIYNINYPSFGFSDSFESYYENKLKEILDELGDAKLFAVI